INASNSFSGQVVSYFGEKTTSVITDNGWSYGNGMGNTFGALQPANGRVIALSVMTSDLSTGSVSVRINGVSDTVNILELNNSKSGYVLMNIPFSAGSDIKPIVESGSLGTVS